jgi:glycosyltransferase involved in cell wall biosynthesis
MLNQPLVSILIPAYNAEKWLADTIKSALNQTWLTKEIIIVNDGSRDNTLSVAKQFESPSVKVITQENRGASAARNHALSYAQGDLIQWLDADDLLAPDKIAQQIKIMKTNQDSSQHVYSSAFGQFYYRHQKANFLPDNLWQDHLPIDWLLIKMRENLWMSMDAWLINRRLTEIAGPWDEKLSLDDDGDYICRIVLASHKVIFVSEAKSYCRVGNFGSLSLSNSHRAYESLFTSHSNCISRIRFLEDNERTRSASLIILQRWFKYYYPEYPDLVEKAMSLAKELGGILHPPVLGGKYDLLKKLLGWKAAKYARRVMPMIRVFLWKNWDKLLSKINNDYNKMV